MSSDKIPAGEDLVVVRSKKRTTKKKTPALTKKPVDSSVPSTSGGIESESPPIGFGSHVPPPLSHALSGGGLLKKEEPSALALSLLLSSGMEGEEDEEAIAAPAAAVSAPAATAAEGSVSPRLRSSSSGEGAGLVKDVPSSKGSNWKLGSAFKAAWQSTSSKVTAFVLRNSSSVLPDEQLPPPANAREADLRIANYVIRLAVVGIASEAVGASTHNVRLVRESCAKHSVLLSQYQQDCSAAAGNMAKLQAEMQVLAGFSVK